MKRKRTLLCTILCVFMMCFSVLPVNAASSNYIIGNWGIRNIGKYQVKVDQNALYSRKKSLGKKWKKLSNNCHAYTTNGSKIYYARGNYNYTYDTGNASIYVGSIKGGKSKRIVTLRNRAIDQIYYYNNKLYVEERYGKHGNSIGVYSLKTHQYRRMVSGELLSAYKGYGIVTNSTYKWTYPLYSMNLLSGKKKKIESYSYGGANSGKYMYYAAFTNNTRAYQVAGNFVIKRVTVSGSGKKTLTRNLYGIVQHVTSKYVEYESNGITRRAYY